MKFKKKNLNIEKEKTETDLRRLKRIDLLELLLEQAKETEKLRQQIKELERQLENRAICINEAGNIAEASLAINHVMEDAQNAARQYLENVQKQCSQIQKETIQKCEAMELETRKRCEEMEQEAVNYCKHMGQNASDEF